MLLFDALVVVLWKINADLRIDHQQHNEFLGGCGEKLVPCKTHLSCGYIGLS